MVEIKIVGNKVIKEEIDKSNVCIGSINLEERVFTSTRSADGHLHFVHNGWGVDVNLIEMLEQRDIKIIHIYDTFFGEDYYSEIDTLKMFGIEEEYGGHGKQIILPKLYWGTTPDFHEVSKGFAHLHVHYTTSLLDGLGTVEELVLKARRMGMNSIAMTDHGNVSGIYKFHNFCKSVGMKPIIGCEFYMVDDISVKARERNHCIVLAKNKTGYNNLLRLSTESNLNGFYYVPRIDKQMLTKYADGLIILSACIYGYPAQKILQYLSSQISWDDVVAEIRWWKELFGDRYYLELQPDCWEKYIEVNPYIVQLSKELGIVLVATCDVHYIEDTDKQAHDVLIGIHQKKTLKENPGFGQNSYWLHSKGSVEYHFEKYHPLIAHGDWGRAMANTQKIADQIELFDIKEKAKFPKIENKTLRGELESFLSTASLEYFRRIDYEIGVIEKNGFTDYFLLIMEIVKWAKSQGIQVAPGRGSVSGSLVAFALGITEVDPIKHGLIFERFLHPSRKSPPDIDIDFDASRRDEVVDYIRSRWSIAKISTYISMQGKGAIKDCCRVYDIPYSVAESMCEIYQNRQTLVMSIDRAIIEDPIFMQFFKEYTPMFRVARRLEGRLKSRGQHPAGIIISDDDISSVVALRREDGSSGDLVIQCDMSDAESLGLLKVDCLGSKTQTILAVAKKSCGIDYTQIPLDDENVYREFRKGNTLDIFQFQSELGRETVMKVKPKDFDTLTAITALVRPGAYDFIDSFAKNDYQPLMEELRPILKNTRNIILYQEQAMKIAVDIAGFTFERADDLRRAIGKKKVDEMSSLRGDFISGGIRLGHKEEEMFNLFKIIERSSMYSFNLSHAIAYTLVSYWSMYLKIYHPLDWFVAELTVQVDDEEKLKRYLDDAIKSGISFLSPDVNASEFGFSRSGNAIRCGLGMIKKLSDNGYAEIIKYRPYSSLQNFFDVVAGNKCNKGAVESMIKAGAFSSLGTRKSHFTYLQNLKNKVKGAKVEEYGEWDADEIAAGEKESLGFYLSGHPIMKYKDTLLSKGVDFSDGLIGGAGKVSVKVSGMVDSIREFNSKNGLMAFLKITGFKDYDLLLWNPTYMVYKTSLSIGDVIVVRGRWLEQGKIAVDVGKGDFVEFINEKPKN